MKKGIDVSKHNGTIDWQKVKNSGEVDFAILRAGYGKLASQKDIQFERNYAGAKAVGIPIGCYWYSYAKTVSEARQEAYVFLQVIKGKQFEYPVYLDFEEQAQFKTGKNNCSAMARVFLEIVEQAGYFTGIYSSKSGLENYITPEIRNRYTVWVAHVNVTKTSYAMPYDIWQYSWKGRVNGITGNSGDVDMNYCYRDFPAIIKNAGLNGFTKSEKPENVETVENPVESVEIVLKADGKTYSGVLTAE
jgi:GH25 family lysozyme M1 (1,4-beta-N-acetylmuramidase)